MQSKTIFQNKKPVKNLTKNSSGGNAFSKSSEQTLAQLVVSSFVGGTFYTSAEQHLELIKKLASEVSAEFLAACAIYSRDKGYMKDMPVVLLTLLRERDSKLYRETFSKVVDNSRILRGLVSTIRSGKLGSKNLNNGTRKLIQKWFDSKHPVSLWNDSIGNNPSLKDIINLSHVSPGTDPARQAVMTLICKGEKSENLPEVIKSYYAWAKDKSGELPKVPFQRLTNEKLSVDQWKTIGRNMTWNQLRLNLNTLERNGCFNDEQYTKEIASRLDSKDEVKKSKLQPFELLTSVNNVSNNLLKRSLQNCLDYSVDNVPDLPYNTYIAVDVSGSMGTAVNSNNVNRGLSCAQVAGLMSLSLLSKNPNVKYLTFDTAVKDYTQKLNSKDSLSTNLTKINFNGGGTDCSAPMKHIHSADQPVDLIIMLSDNESWADYIHKAHNTTGTKAIWNKIKSKNPNAKFVMIDLAGSNTTQLSDDKNVLNISGFNSNIFDLITNWLKGDTKDFVTEVTEYAKNKE